MSKGHPQNQKFANIMSHLAWLPYLEFKDQGYRTCSLSMCSTMTTLCCRSCFISPNIAEIFKVIMLIRLIILQNSMRSISFYKWNCCLRSKFAQFFFPIGNVEPISFPLPKHILPLMQQHFTRKPTFKKPNSNPPLRLANSDCIFFLLCRHNTANLQSSIHNRLLL